MIAKVRGALGTELRAAASCEALGAKACPWVPPCPLDVLWQVANISGDWIAPDTESWQRYSLPQARKIGMEGVAGLLRLSGQDISSFADLFAIARVTHIGGRVAFGQGRFVVEGVE
jgi:hypothetical protein